MIEAYYYLAKPGIIYGNIITAIAGFALASQGDIDVRLLAATLAGTALIIGSGCVFNNVIDRGVDSKMKRTKKRALVTGKISVGSALVYGTVLSLIGYGLLIAYTNWITVAVGAVGIFTYVVLYGWTKRRSIHGTAVGTIPGAMPPVAGYTAVSGTFDSGAWILLLILVFWQLAHFYAIAIFRLKEYAAAGLPVLPVKLGVGVTKVHIMVHIAAFTVMTILLSTYGYTSSGYLLVALFLGISWFVLGVRGFMTAQSNDSWARSMFLYSLVVLTSWSVIVTLDAIL